MKEISCGEFRVKAILPKNKVVNPRKICCLVENKIEAGYILFNLLTRNIVFLSNEEYSSFFSSEYAIENYFTVDENFNEHNTIKSTRNILYKIDNDNRFITDYKYVIFTTLDCNARCSYCFENGFKSKKYMSKSTALKVARYIAERANGKKVNITWFGGEPLLNREVINTISNYLLEHNIEFESFFFTNGYLIDDDFIYQAKKNWNLKAIEVTIDGTKQIYNRIKNFTDQNAFAVVTNNLLKVSKAEINVIIRINLCLENYNVMVKLLDELRLVFGTSNNISLHIEKLYLKKQGICDLNLHTIVDQLEIKYREFIELAEKKGIKLKIDESWKCLKVSNCYADRAGGNVIFPNGTIGMCEHYIDDFIVGDVCNDVYNHVKQTEFRNRMIELEDCSKCFLYSDCLRMKNCDFHHDICSSERRKTLLWRISRNLYQEYVKDDRI